MTTSGASSRWKNVPRHSRGQDDERETNHTGARVRNMPAAWPLCLLNGTVETVQMVPLVGARDQNKRRAEGRASHRRSRLLKSVRTVERNCHKARRYGFRQGQGEEEEGEMTDTQLYLAIGVPVAMNLLGFTLIGIMLNWTNQRLTAIEARLLSLEARVGALETRVGLLEQGFDILMKKFA
jgi:hypothetical protein